MFSKKGRIILVVILIFGMVAIWAMFRGLQEVESLSLDQYIEFLQKEYPKVEHISTQELANALQDQQNLLLVDCRTAEEFEVSHIIGAQHCKSIGELDNLLLSRAEPPSQIIVYCSVGLRSAKFIEAFKKAGFKNSQTIPCKNVVGSIFSWANENRPLENNAGNSVDQVHPYDTFWKRMLDEGKAIDLQ